MTKKRKIVFSVAGVLGLMVIFLAGKIGAIPVPGVKSVFQTPGTCSSCHETWYDEASYAFNPRGNKKPPRGVTIGCAECHPVQYEEYQLSAMGSSKNPLRPGCTNCHDNVHSFYDWFNYMYLAPKAWIREVQIALRDRDFYNRTLAPELANKARAQFVAVDSRRCRECHTDPAHRSLLKGTIGEFRPDIPPHQEMVKERTTCVQCHQNLMHNLSYPAPWTGKPTAAENGNLKAGEMKSKICAACHGNNGNSQAPLFPSVAELNANYIFLQLESFKNGSRKNATMQGIAASLSTEDMANLAKYYSRQEMYPTITLPKVLSLRARANLEIGQQLYREKCSRCHGFVGRGQGIFPRLAGQHPEYMLTQADAFTAGTRAPHSIMRNVVAGLNGQDMKLIADYLGSLK